MNHRKGAAQFAVPANEGVMGIVSIGTLVAEVGSVDDVEEAAGRAFAGVVFHSEDFAIAACDYAKGVPHASGKAVEFAAAPNGILGLETAFPVVSDLVRTGEMTPLQLIERMSTTPARIFGLGGGSLREGEPADVVILDPEAQWTYEPAEGFSKSRNSPWSGQTLTGRVEATFVNGRLVYRAGRGVVIQ